MKKLQNNFTTPEQSERLLELGVPADSADCILLDESEDVFSFKKYHHMVIELPAYEFHKQSMISGRPDYLPCWSVGRLMEIIDICSIKQDYAGKFEFEINKSYTQNLIYLIIGMLHMKHLDFSKLED